MLFYYCRVPKEWAWQNKMSFNNIWNRFFIADHKHDLQSKTDFMINIPKKKNIIFIDNKPSKDNVNKMYKQNWGDYLFSLNIWGVHLIYGICMWDMFFTKGINEKLVKISCFQYYIIVYFLIIWWCYYLLDFTFALLFILVQTKNYSFIDYFSIHSVSFCACPKLSFVWSMFGLLHQANISSCLFQVWIYVRTYVRYEW